MLDVLRRRTVRRIIWRIVLWHWRNRRIGVPLLGGISTLIDVRVVISWLLLLRELRFGVCVASDTWRWLRRIDGSHGGATLLGCGVAILSATQDEEDYGADESETEERANDYTGYPGFGT